MRPTKTERIERVKKFQEACLLSGLAEIAPHVYELRGLFTRTITLCTLIHGNEIGGIEVFLELLEEIHSGKLKLKSNLRLMLGNVDAYYEDKRFLESDMNRSFGLDNPVTKEEIRAHEIEKFLQDSDVLLDIHQTIGPTNTPFFIFELDQPSYNLARHLHAALPIITYSMKREFKGKTSTAYAISKNCISVTIETGQKAIDETQISLGLELARKTLETDFTNVLPDVSLSHTFTFSQIISNPDGSLEMVKFYRNFDPVKKGELLAKNPVIEIHSEVDGIILFAKYGDYAKVSIELALILKPVHGPDDLTDQIRN